MKVKYYFFRLISLCLVSAFLISCVGHALAVEHAPSQDSQLIYIDKATRDADIQRQANEIMETLNNVETRSAISTYSYEYEYENDYKYKTLGGYPEQASGGYKFSAPGGSFWWQDKGGPSVSGSVSFSAPAKVFSFSIGLGVANTSSGVGVA